MRFRFVAGLFASFGVVCAGMATVATPAGAQTAPSNDNFAAAKVIANASGSTSGNNVYATMEPGEATIMWSNDRASVWFKWTVAKTGRQTFDTFGSEIDSALAVHRYSGTNGVRGLTSVVASGESEFSDDGTVSFRAVAGETFYIQVLTEGSNNTGNFKLNWSNVPSPANDHFANAETILWGEGTKSANNRAATMEPSEPTVMWSNDRASVWYRWQCVTTAVQTFDTFGSEIDSALAVYTYSGSGGVAGLKEVASSGESASSDDGTVNIRAVAGQIFYIQVVTEGSNSEGKFQLNWSMTPSPQNDDFAAAYLLSGSNGSVSGTNRAASFEAGEKTVEWSNDRNSVWFRWQAPVSGAVVFDTFGSDFNTALAVYTGSSVPALTKVVSNGDYSNSNQSRVTFSATAGTIYSIQIVCEGSADSGRYTLNWTAAGPVTYSLSGRVTELVNGFPTGVFRATVTCSNGKTFTTGPEGDFFFSGLANATYTVTATATDRNVSPTFTMAPWVTVSGASVTERNFDATKGLRSIRGRALRYVPNATHTAVTETGIPNVLVARLLDNVQIANTDANGYYNLAQVPAGDYLVAASARGYAFNPFAHRVIVGNADRTGFFFYSYAVQGQAFKLNAGSTTRVPLANAEIWINGTLRTKTDANGRYVVYGFDAGTQTVTAKLAGYTFPSLSVSTPGSGIAGVSPNARGDLQGAASSSAYSAPAEDTGDPAPSVLPAPSANAS